MNTFGKIITIAAGTALGCCVYRAVIRDKIFKADKEEKENSSAYSEYKEQASKGGKVRRASMYAVGTIKTTADKISEGIKQVKSSDMVKKGEQAIEHIKETGTEIKEHIKGSASDIKDDVNELKDLVSSINTSPADADNAFEDEGKNSIPEVNSDEYEKEEDEAFEIIDSAEPAEQL